MKKTLFSVDVENDGPCPGLYSMVSIGVARVTRDRSLSTDFYGRTAPLPGAKFDPETLAISGTTREQHLAYPPASHAMDDLLAWLNTYTPAGTHPVLISDNPAHDWQFVNYYFHLFHGKNPFGYTARRIGDLYAGFVGDASRSSEWRKFVKTPHTHHPVMDAIGVAEALLAMVDMGLEIEGL